MRSNLIDVDCRYVHSTERAILVEFEGEEIWVPLAWCEVIRQGDRCTLTMERHRAEEKGFI